MDTSSASQKDMRKVLRSRRIRIPVKPKNVQPKKVLEKPSMKRSITNNKLDDEQDFIPKKSSSRNEHDKFTDGNAAKPKKSSPRKEHDKYIGEDSDCSKSSGSVNKKSKIGKLETKIKATPTGKSDTKHQNKNSTELEQSSISNLNDIEDDPQRPLTLSHQDERAHKSHEQEEKMMEEVDHFEEGDQYEGLQDMLDNQIEPEDEDDDVENSEGLSSENDADDNNADDTDADDPESLSGNCLDGILSGFNKDIGVLYSKTDSIERDVKEIKRLLKVRASQPCSFRPLSSRLKEVSATSLLPKIPLGKRSFVRKMESDADENSEYKEQMIRKLASYGGKSVQEVVINIFKKLFTPKLKTKYCWMGSSKGNGKKPFKIFPNIIEIIWMAVKVHFESCTEVMVIQEIKNRFNQADKDYERTKQKQ